MLFIFNMSKLFYKLAQAYDQQVMSRNPFKAKAITAFVLFFGGDVTCQFLER